MLELVAQGKKANHRWRRPLKENVPFVIGRATTDWPTDWDEKVSRKHARGILIGQTLQINKLPPAANPIFHIGREAETFSLCVGEHFVIGNTTFTLSEQRAFATLDLPKPDSQRSYSTEFLHQVRYRDANQRMAALNRLPEVISSSANQSSLSSQLVNLLLEGIPSATSVAICRRIENGEIEIVHWDGRESTSGDFQPSARLIAEAVARQESTLHIWRAGIPSTTYTLDVANDWAFVCPLSRAGSEGWSIYVTGRSRSIALRKETDSDTVDLQGDIKFTELIGATLSNLRRLQELERRHSSLRMFFSPVVMETFADQDLDDALTPRRCHLSVLFCDLRGFSARTEKMSDRLEELLDRVSQALGIMTKEVLDGSGVIGDFHGDSAMGFWGWPIAKSNTAIDACCAALAIQSQLHAIAIQQEHSLHVFRMGLGIATGPAVAGRIGTAEQVKVTAFGPVVNLAARLEGMTSLLNHSILIDAPTASEYETQLTETDKQGRIRRLGLFQPYGLKWPSEVYQLIPENDQVPDHVRTDYARGLDLFERKQWKEALAAFESNIDLDGATRFLANYIRRHDSIAPPNWNGTIQLRSKWLD
jgi:adenylate cyclase